MLKQLKFPQLLRHVSVQSGTIIRELFRAYSYGSIVLVVNDVVNVMAANQLQ
jgi:hypothetical protein